MFRATVRLSTSLIILGIAGAGAACAQGAGLQGGPDRSRTVPVPRIVPDPSRPVQDLKSFPELPDRKTFPEKAMPGPSAPDLSRSFEAMRLQLAGQKRQLERVTASGLNGACAKARAYSEDSVKTAYDQLRDQAFSGLETPEALPLKDLLEKKFPALPRAQPTECFKSFSVYRAETVNGLWQGFTDFFSYAAAHAKPMKVKVETDVADASARLSPTAGGNPYAPQWTDCTFDIRYRGMYTLGVEKDGYKEFKKDMGVLSGDVVTIKCRMASSGASESSRCAVRK